jgi:hypothetical protein
VPVQALVPVPALVRVRVRVPGPVPALELARGQVLVRGSAPERA